MEKVNIKDSIERLQSDEEYYGEFGSQFLHNSDIYTFLNNPQGYGTPKEDTIPMMFGRAFHEQVLFNNTNQDYIDASTRNTKIYKESLIEYGENLMLLKKEYDDIVSLKNKSQSHKIVSDILNDPNIKKEVPNLNTLTDSEIIWACKADIITDDYVYSTMFQKPMRFIVVEKGSGAIGLFDTSDGAYERGREKVLQAEAMYKKYFLYNEDDIANYFKYDTI